jgi:hypothetical protein
VGLLIYGMKAEKRENSPLFKGIGRIGDKIPLKGIAGKVINLIKSFLP